MASDEWGIEIHERGIKELKRALRGADTDIRRDLTTGIRRAAGPVKSAVASRAPRKQGTLAGSVTLRNRPGGVAVGSPLVYAPVIEFAHKYTAKLGAPPRFVIPGVNTERDDVERDIARVVDQTLDRLMSS